MSMSSVELGTKESSSPEAIAAFGADAVVFQRLILKVAADTYGDPVTLSAGHPRHRDDSADVRRRRPCPRDTIAAPVNLGSVLQLSLDPFNAPFAIAMTDFGSVKQIAGSPPKLTLSAQTPRAFRVGSDGGIRLNLQQPVFEVTATPDSWGATFGVTTFELTIPKSAAGDLLGIFLPSAASSCAASCCSVSTADGFHFDGGVGLSASWPDVVHLPGVVDSQPRDERGGLGFRLPDQPPRARSWSLSDPLTVTIEGFGIAQPLRLTTDGSGNLGILDLQPPSFATPTGIGVAIDAERRQGRRFPADHGHADRGRARAVPRRSVRWSSRFRRSASSSRSTASCRSSSSCR